MNCEDVRNILDGYADGELDLVNHLQIEQHLEQCPSCKQAVENRAALRSALADDSLYFRAPGDLRKKILASLHETEQEREVRSEPEPRPPRWWQWRWIPVLAAAAIVAAVLIPVFTFLRPPASSEDLLAKEIVSAHVRSMMPNHLMDVPSTDQHTVKPWFGDKLDFSPPVIDLTSQGFALRGGRLDYADGRPVAALVYQRRLHVINLFVFPTQDGKEAPNKLLVRQGFNIVHWNRSGMTFWAISDLNLNELQEFAQDLQS